MSWLVKVYGYDDVLITAATRNKARYQAFKRFREAYPITFREFLARGVKVRQATS